MEGNWISYKYEGLIRKSELSRGFKPRFTTKWTYVYDVANPDDSFELHIFEPARYGDDVKVKIKIQ